MPFCLNRELYVFRLSEKMLGTHFLLNFSPHLFEEGKNRVCFFFVFGAHL